MSTPSKMCVTSPSLAPVPKTYLVAWDVSLLATFWDSSPSLSAQAGTNVDAVKDARHEPLLGPGAEDVLGRLGRQLARHVLGLEPVPLGPGLDPVRDRGQTLLLALAALVLDRRVVAAVELEDGHVVAAGAARDLNPVRVARGGIDVEGGRHGREGGDALRERLVTREHARHAAAVALARSEDPLRVDAVVLL